MSYIIRHNNPSPGFISWENLNMQYNGTSYAIANGNTDKVYAWWAISNPDVLQSSNTFPTLTAADALVLLNKNGTAVLVPGATILDGALIVPGSIIADALSANSVTGEKILAGSIDTTHIKAGAVTADTVAAMAIGAAAIAASAINTDHLSSGVITADKIVSGAITSDKIAANAIISTKIASGAITTDKLAASAITADKIATNTITANKLNVTDLAAISGSFSALMSGNATGARVTLGQSGGIPYLYMYDSANKLRVELLQDRLRFKGANGAIGGFLYAENLDGLLSGMILEAANSIIVKTTSGNYISVDDGTDPAITINGGLAVVNGWIVANEIILGNSFVRGSRTAYSYANGILVDTGISENTLNVMYVVRVVGNGYGHPPIDTVIQAYHYQPVGTWLNAMQTNFGAPLGTAKFMRLNGKIAVWFPQGSSFQTLNIEVFTNSGVVNNFIVSNSVEPAGSSKVTCAVRNNLLLTDANGYPGMTTPDGGTTDWIRTTVNGIIPYQSGGHGSIGTSTWPFTNGYINNFVFKWAEFDPDSAGDYKFYFDKSGVYSGNTRPTFKPSADTFGFIGLSTMRFYQGFASGGWLTSSQMDMKENIRVNDDAVAYERLKNLNFYKYNFKPEYEGGATTRRKHRKEIPRMMDGKSILDAKGQPVVDVSVEEIEARDEVLGVLVEDLPDFMTDADRTAVNTYALASFIGSALKEAINRIEALESKAKGVA